MNHKLIETSAEVYHVIWARHGKLEPYSSYSAPDGDQFGSVDQCCMCTEWMIPGTDFPILRHEHKWEKDPDREFGRINETHNYWICIGKEDK